jgi:hypothetical protein
MAICADLPKRHCAVYDPFSTRQSAAKALALRKAGAL